MLGSCRDGKLCVVLGQSPGTGISMEFLIGLNNKKLESDIEKNAERSERSKPLSHLTSLVSQQTSK